MSAASYTVHLVAEIEHVDGSEPAWEKVALAVCHELEAATVQVGRSRVLVDRVLLDTAGEDA